jgi:hypothetical protein
LLLLVLPVLDVGVAVDFEVDEPLVVVAAEPPGVTTTPESQRLLYQDWICWSSVVEHTPLQMSYGVDLN